MAETVFRDVELDDGFKRGDQTITKVTLRRPKAGELRGLSSVDVMRQDYAAVAKLLPRISNPIITELDVAELTAPDFEMLAAECGCFFLNRRQRAEAGLTD